MRPTNLGKAKDWGREQRVELRDQRLSSNDRKYGVWGFWPHSTSDPAPIAKASQPAAKVGEVVQSRFVGEKSHNLSDIKDRA